MDRYKKGDDRNQMTMEPMCLDDMISADAEVRVLELIVDKMDVRSLGFTHCETKQTGRMPYDPVDMFKLYTYSYFNGIRSSRKIEKECHRNIELMWLIGNLCPDFKTIADFRRDNKKQIKAAFQRFSTICEELGLIGKEIVAVDGSKFRASNSRLRYHSVKKLDEKIKYHAEKAEQYIKLLDACDKEEESQPQLTREKIIERIDKINERLVALSALREEVSKNGTIYETDSDARMMQTNNKGPDICHNVQIAVDDKSHLVVAVDVTSQQLDKEQLYNIASQAKENMSIDKLTVVADKGYYSAKEFEKCENNGIEPIVSKADQSFHANTSGYEKDNFIYDEENNRYICPAGVELSPFRNRTEGSIRYANIKACKKCPQKSDCTKGKYRMIHVKTHERYARIIDKRTKDKMGIYKKRQMLVEHPFGTVKRALGFTYFLTRGTENVRTESVMHFLIYNMKRVINTVGMRGLATDLQR